MANNLRIKYILGPLLILFGIFLVFWKKQPGQEIIYSIHTHQKIVALTYDDGPHPVYTYQLLDILSKYHVKVTFFMIGAFIKRYPYIVKQVIAKGHSIGNHTYTHPFNITVCSNSQIVKELNDSESIIRQIIGRRVLIFRPPRGLFNHKVIRIAKKRAIKRFYGLSVAIIVK